METAREWLAGASRIAVLTGAGVSEESGVPTFRGEGGPVAPFPARGTGHAGSLRAGPEAGLGMVQLAA